MSLTLRLIIGKDPFGLLSKSLISIGKNKKSPAPSLLNDGVAAFITAGYTFRKDTYGALVFGTWSNLAI